MSQKPLTVPVESNWDMAHSLGDATLNSIPVIGPAGAFLYNELIKPAYSRRQAEFWQEVATRIQALESEGRLSLEQLKSDPAFTDALMQASLIVTRMSSEQKRQALRNAVLNSALPTAPEDSRQMMFLHWVESYTPFHIRTLSFMVERRSWFEASRGDEDDSLPSNFHIDLTRHVPELSGEPLVRMKILNDLKNDSLLLLHVAPDGGRTIKASSLAQEFVEFITEPTIE